MFQASGLTVILILGYFANKALDGIVSDYALSAWRRYCEQPVSRMIGKAARRLMVWNRKSLRPALAETATDPLVDAEARINLLLKRIDVLERDNIRLVVTLSDRLRDRDSDRDAAAS